jgi:hypothetical protein
VNFIENVGDAIDVALENAPVEVVTEWHDLKVRALSGDDREKKVIAFRHLTAADFLDDVVVASLMESLDRDPSVVATAFAFVAATQIDPSAREDIVNIVAGEVETLEKRRSPRAAYFASLLDQMFANHPDAQPTPELLATIERIIVTIADPFSFAAFVEVCSRDVQHGNTSWIQRWLGDSAGRLIVFAISVIEDLDLDALADLPRTAVCEAVAGVRRRVTSDAGTDVLAAAERQWILSAIDKTLLRCKP